jgi:hypothetical protein
LFILTKYFWYLQKDEAEIFNKLQEFVLQHKPEYSENVRNGIIRKTIASAKRGVLVFDKRISIYENELNIIKSLNDINLEKLLFTYLVLSKFFNGLFKVSRAEIFRFAKIDIHNLYKPKLIHKLNQTGYAITTIKKGKALRGVNIKPEGEAVLEFVADEDFIYQYLFYIGDNGMIKCKECGKPILKTSRNKKYCNNCKNLIQKIQKHQWQQRFRNLKKS